MLSTAPRPITIGLRRDYYEGGGEAGGGHIGMYEDYEEEEEEEEGEGEGREEEVGKQGAGEGVGDEGDEGDGVEHGGVSFVQSPRAERVLQFGTPPSNPPPRRPESDAGGAGEGTAPVVRRPTPKRQGPKRLPAAREASTKPI